MRKHQNFINFLSKQTLISRSLSQSKKIRRRIYDGDTRLPCMDLVVVWIGEKRREMEESSYVCGINHLDGDNRLPPRKRLLAGLKKQNCDHNSASASPSSISSSFSSRLNNLLNSNSKSSRLSPDEILDASKSAALAAAKVAAAARARATEKAEVAAKAVAAAKNALELVASVSEETSGKERSLRKNKSKKHVPVELLYKKRRSGMKSETDEEIARKLHRAMNSSPRISKGSLPSDLKTQNHKKHRKQLKLEKCRVSDGGELRAARPPSVCVRIAEAGDMNFRGRVDAVELLSMDRKDKQDNMLCTKADRSDMVDISPPDRETEASYLNDKYWQVAERGGTTGRKRGRIKQKKLSLSLCTIRDRENPKEEPKSNGFPSMKEPHGKCAAEMPLFSANSSTKDPMVTTGSAL